MIKYLLLLVTATMLLSAEKITYKNIPEEITQAIIKNECLIEKGKCNPFVITFNRDKDIKKAKKLGYKIIHKRVLKCYNEPNCVRVTKRLLANNITSIDLGPYQVNYYYNPDKKINRYFHFELATIKASTILATLINKHGYSWKTLGRYHSGTPHRNKAYYTKLYTNIESLK